jgi:hypothetical protein
MERSGQPMMNATEKSITYVKIMFKDNKNRNWASPKYKFEVQWFKPAYLAITTAIIMTIKIFVTLMK